VSGGLPTLRAFCQWKIEHQVRKCCVKGLILRNMARRERDVGRLYQGGYKQWRAQNFGGAKYLDCKRATAFCSGHCLSKHKWQDLLEIWGAWPPLVTPGYAYGYKKRNKKKEQHLLDVHSSIDKNLITMQDRQTLQKSGKKEYCQYWMLCLVFTNLDCPQSEIACWSSIC